MTSTAVPATPTPKESDLQKLWDFVKKEFSAAETGIDDVFGAGFANAIKNAGEELAKSNLLPIVSSALIEATDVATGQMSVSKAAASLVTQLKAAGKNISQEAALQVIAVGQNLLPANPSTVTVTA